MEILIVLIVMVVIMLVAARFDNADGSSAKTADGDAKKYSSLDDEDDTTSPSLTARFMVGNINHDED